MKALSTTDIIQHLQQHPSFGGCFPLDKIPPITHYPCSIVVNTEKAGEKGEHWVALFMERGLCCYFDSLGFPILEKELCQYLQRTYTSVIYNKTTIQDWSSELCGYFCILFVEQVNSVESYASFVQQFNPYELKQNDVILHSLFKNKH